MNSNFEKKLFPDEYIYDPVSVIERFSRATQKYGKETTLKDRRFQKARELWISAVFLLGFYEITTPQQDYWLRPCYDEWPDIFGVFFSSRQDLDDTDVENRFYLEITEWDDHSKLDLAKQALEKAKKKYPQNYTLVIYAKKIGVVIDVEAIFDKVRSSNPSNLYIFLVSSNKATSGDHSVVCLHPDKAQINFYLKDLMKKQKKVYDFVMVERSRGRDISPPTSVPFPLPELE